MAPPLTRVICDLHRLAQPPASDGELLRRFVATRDDAAFQSLVERHGPMVLRLCRRLIGDAHLAEDAYQATFVVLARKATTLGHPASLTSWLYGVAQRVALNARRSRRCLPALTDARDPSPDPLSALTARELLVVLEEELGRLPESQRMAVVLCCMEGLSREEAAGRLGCTLGALRGSLERGRQRLHARLVKRGVTLTAALAAAEVVHGNIAAVTISGNAASGEALQLAADALRGGALLKVPVVLLAFVLGTGTLWCLASGTAMDETLKPAAPQVAAAGQRGHHDHEGQPLPAEALARIGSTRLRHSTVLRTVTYSPDGKSIVSFGWDGYVCFWHAVTGRLQHRIDASGLTPFEAKRMNDVERSTSGACAFDRTGKQLLVFNSRSNLAIDVETGQTSPWLRGANLAGNGNLACFDPARTVLAVPLPRRVVVVDVASGKERCRTPTVEARIISVAVAPNTRLVAVALDRSGVVLLFDAQTGALRQRLEGPDHSAGSLAFTPDGKRLFSGRLKGVLWDLDTAKVVTTIAVGSQRCCAAFSPDGKRLAVGGVGDLRIIDVPTGKELHRLPADDRNEHTVSCLAFARDGARLLVGGGQGDISQWDVATGRLLEPSAMPYPQVSELSFLDERRLRLFARTFETWDWRAGTRLERAPAYDRPKRGTTDVSRDGRWFAHTAGNGTIALVDARQGEAQRLLDGHRGGTRTVRFSPNGRTLFSTGQDRVVRGWDVESGTLRHQWKDEGALHDQLVVSPDGRWVVTGNGSGDLDVDREVRVWDVRANRLAHTLAPAGTYYLRCAFSADGRQLAIAGALIGQNAYAVSIEVFDTTTGRRLATFTGHSLLVEALAFSPDGRCLVVADSDVWKTCSFRYWELATHQERHRFKGQTDTVYSLAFSPSGALLAAASADAPAYVWDVYGRQSPPAKPWTAAEGQQLWQALGSTDAMAGFDSLRRLIRSSGPALALIRGRLERVEPIDAQRVKQWLAELDADDFTQRQVAFTALEQLGERVETALRQALAGKLNLEAKRRVESLVAKLETPTPERLARGRALEALEQIGTLKALRLLDDLSRGDAAARLTQEAAESRDRMRQREFRRDGR